MQRYAVYERLTRFLTFFLTKPRGIIDHFLIKPRGIIELFLTKPRGIIKKNTRLPTFLDNLVNLF